MAERWRNDDRFERGGRSGFAGDRYNQGGERSYGDDERDLGGQYYGVSRQDRSAYSGWGQDGSGGYDDYTRSSNRDRDEQRSSYGQGSSYDPGDRYGQGSNYDRYRGGSGRQADQRYGASSGGGYESGGYGVDDGGRMSGYGLQRGSGNWGGYGSGGYQGWRSDSNRFDRSGGYRGGSSYGDQQRGGDWRGGEDRGWMERAGDEVRSWFGDEDAERRRQQDEQHRGRGPKGYTRSDERIREDVCDRLSDDWRIDASDIEVQVQDGEVTLTGSVNDRQLKRRAEDVAEEISGVRNVQNNLRVQGQQSQATNAALGATNAGMSSATSTTGTSPTPATRSALGTEATTKS